MKDNREERKSLSKTGTSRLSNKALFHVWCSKEQVGNYYNLMDQTIRSTGGCQYGYIMFEDLQNKTITRNLDESVIGTEVEFLRMK
eukprot:7357283-Heterocapsa_arctica.AAC.1